MALTPSNMLPLGTFAPDFSLPDPLQGKDFSRDELRREAGLLVMFICNHCPYVRHIEQGLRNLGVDYRDSQLGIVAISANDVAVNEEDAPQYMAEKEYPFPYLYDESQDTARAYQAACTPDFFLFDRKLALVYRGQFDGSRPGNDQPVTGDDLRDAMDRVLLGRPVEGEQLPSIGCNIKWK